MFVVLFSLSTFLLALTLASVSLGGLATLHQTFSGWCFLQSVIRISGPGRLRPTRSGPFTASEAWTGGAAADSRFPSQPSVIARALNSTWPSPLLWRTSWPCTIWHLHAHLKETESASCLEWTPVGRLPSQHSEDSWLTRKARSDGPRKKAESGKDLERMAL